MSEFTVSGKLVDIANRRIYPATVKVAAGKISSIQKDQAVHDQYILPGFVDAHVHIESSMLIPSEFARLATLHGTVATVSDPHEIANVIGIDGVRFMINNGKKVPFKFYFGAPSCVPATTFETAGAEITADDIRELFEVDGLKYLSEMMNYPGVLFRDPMVMEKLGVAKEFNRPIDGHAPGLRGELARKYLAAGISTDHECYLLEEAKEKLGCGAKVIIREGSAAKNYNELHPLIPDHYKNLMFCSDDKHPNDLVVSQIDDLVRRSIAHGYDVFQVLQIACVNPVLHYDLDVGLLETGDPADFIVVDNLVDFNVRQTFIDGVRVAESNQPLIDRVPEGIVNRFQASEKSPSDFKIQAKGSRVRVIEALNGELITKSLEFPVKVENGCATSDTENDVLKLAVMERYQGSRPAIAFIKNFGLKRGAIASCVAHDSHNMICVGVTDEEMSRAVNAIIQNKGGLSVCDGGNVESLPLPVAGIMSNEEGFEVAKLYSRMDALAKELGTQLTAPFMTLSFMALLVIPSLKLSDQGLFDGTKFEFTDLFADA
jgi:adenine deaminase